MDSNIIPNSETLFLSQKHLTKIFSNSYLVGRPLVDICEGKKNAAAILHRLVYWSSPSKEGKSRLRIKKKGQYWIAKTDKDWWLECRLTVADVRKVVKYLEGENLIEKKKFKFKGSPVCHYRINRVELEQRMDLLFFQETMEVTDKERTNIPQVSNSIQAKPQMDLSNSSETITDNTSDSTSFPTTTQRALCGGPVTEFIPSQDQSDEKQAFQEHCRVFCQEYGCSREQGKRKKSIEELCYVARPAARTLSM